MSFSSEVSKVNAESCVPVESSSKAITTLPNEILFKIYDDLGIGDLKELSVTCKSLNSAQIVRGAKGYDILELKRFIQDLIPKLKNVMAMDKFINKFFEDENLYRQINANNFPTRNFDFRHGFEALYEKSIRKLESMNAEIDLENTAKSDLTNLQDRLVRILAPFQLGSESTLYSGMNGLDCRKNLYNSIKTYLQDQIQNSSLDAEKIQSLHEICSLDFQTNPLEFKDLSFYKSIFSASRMLYNVIFGEGRAIQHFNREVTVSRSHQSSQEKNQLGRLGFFPESYFYLIDQVNTPIDIEDAIEAYKNIQNPQKKTKAKLIVAFYYMINDQKAKAKEFLESEVDPANVNKFINLTAAFQYCELGSVDFSLNRSIGREGNLLQNRMDQFILSLTEFEIQRPIENLDIIISIIDEISNPNIKNQALYALLDPIFNKEKINESDIPFIDKIMDHFSTDCGILDYRQLVELRRDLVLGKYDYKKPDDQLIVVTIACEIDVHTRTRQGNLIMNRLADELYQKNFIEAAALSKIGNSHHYTTYYDVEKFLLLCSEKAIELDQLDVFYEKIIPILNDPQISLIDELKKSKLVEKLLDNYVEKVGIENIQNECFLKLIKTFEYYNLTPKILNHFKYLGTKLLGENKIKESLELLSIIQKNSKNFIFKEIICALSPTFREYPDILRPEFYFSNIVKHILSQSKDKEILLPEILLKIFENLNNEQESKINILHKIFDQHFDELFYEFLFESDKKFADPYSNDKNFELLLKEFQSTGKIVSVLEELKSIDQTKLIKLFKKKYNIALIQKGFNLKINVLRNIIRYFDLNYFSFENGFDVISNIDFSVSCDELIEFIKKLISKNDFLQTLKNYNDNQKSFLQEGLKKFDPEVKKLFIKVFQHKYPVEFKQDIELMTNSSFRSDIILKILQYNYPGLGSSKYLDSNNFNIELNKIYNWLPASFDRLLVIRNSLLQTSTSNRLITEFKFLAYAIFEMGAILTNFFKNLFKFKKK